MPMSSNLSWLFLVFETCKQSLREDRWCLCQATCPRCFLFLKHVNKAAGRTGGAVPMSSNLSCLFFVSETGKQNSREDRLCLCQATCPRFFFHLRSGLPALAGKEGCLSASFCRVGRMSFPMRQKPTKVTFVFILFVGDNACLGIF